MRRFSVFQTFHCVKNVQIRSFSWSVFSHMRTEYGKIWTRKKLRIWTLFTQCLCTIGSLMTQFTNLDIEENLAYIFKSNKMLAIHKGSRKCNKKIALLKVCWRWEMTSYLCSILFVEYYPLTMAHATQWYKSNLKLFLHISND